MSPGDICLKWDHLASFDARCLICFESGCPVSFEDGHSLPIVIHWTGLSLIQLVAFKMGQDPNQTITDNSSMYMYSACTNA